MTATSRLFQVAILTALVTAEVFAQGLARRPVRVLVPSPPGGTSDVQIRLLVPKLSEALGQTIVVDDRASNNGIVAMNLGAKATPDGHTLIAGNSGTHAVNATLYAKLSYDPVRDFAPVSQFSTTGMVVVANPRLPTGLNELIAYARKNPGKLNIAIPGATGQLAGDALWGQLNISVTNVNYKGSTPSEFALVSGEADISLLTPLTSLKHLQSGKMKAYGVTSAQRSPVLPDLPTLAEQGVKGYDFQFWNGLFAPAGTPDRMIRAINNGIVRAVRAPEVKEKFDQLGLVVVGSTPGEFREVVVRDVEKYRRIIIESGIPRL
jgi:tripartite-type tricarboxylate transporter receptor subunit TctC